ncbi:SRPBCC family protein [Nocardioides sp. R1-1]|uniref:SRPBCC family protein n=1 Tax=Nocardioides sp. R1-1 TaxID=3383502 RepID=UPI0038D12F49
MGGREVRDPPGPAGGRDEDLGHSPTLATRTGAEEFLVWEPGRQMGFRFNAASQRSIRAFAERYDVEPTAEGCRLTWTLALDVAGPGRHLMPVSGVLCNLAFRRFLTRLRRYTDQRFRPLPP